MNVRNTLRHLHFYLITVGMNLKQNITVKTPLDSIKNKGDVYNQTLSIILW